MKYVEIKAGDRQSDKLVLGNKQLATVFLPPSDTNITLNILTGHDTDAEHLGVLYKDGIPLSVTAMSEYSVHIFNPDDFEGAATLAFISRAPLPKDYKIWIYLHTF